MGADSTLLFYGVRFEPTESELDGLEQRTDPRIARAREHHLAHWWGTFAQDEYNEKDFLFVGTLVGHIGYEGKYEISLRDDELAELMESTRKKLLAATFTDEPRFYAQFAPDY